MILDAATAVSAELPTTAAELLAHIGKLEMERARAFAAYVRLTQSPAAQPEPEADRLLTAEQAAPICGLTARYEIVPEEAATVRRVFEMSDQGYGDLKIAHTLNKDGIPGPRTTWSKETIRTMLRSTTYKGLLVHGKTKMVDRGGDTAVRTHVKEGLIETSVPHMTIVEPALWDRVQARKAQTRARYMRAPKGTLLSKPESGINSTSALLTGFLRCSICGGGMNHVRKNNKSKRYYCVERSRRGGTYCTNSQGIPMQALDEHVLTAINEALQDADTVWELVTERANRWRREHERPKKERENIERQVKRIETEIANLNRQAARGLDIDVQEYNGRKAQIAELQAKLTAPAEIDLDRVALREGLKTIRHFKSGVTLIDDPKNDFIEMKWTPTTGPLANRWDHAGTRAALRKLGVSRIVCSPCDTGGWDFEGLADLSRLASNNGKSAPSEPPPDSDCAGLARARTRFTGRVG